MEVEAVTHVLRWFASRGDSQTTHAVIPTDSMSLEKWNWKASKPPVGVLLRHSGVNRAEQTDLAGKSNPHKWLVSRKIGSVEELETLAAGTKPRTLHHRSPGGERRGIEESLDDLL